MINQNLESCALVHKLWCAADHIPPLSTVTAVGLSEAPCLFLVGLTRNNLILASLSLDHCAVWSRWKQTLPWFWDLLWWVTSVCFQPRAQALRRHSCRRDRHTFGFRGAVADHKWSWQENGAFPFHLQLYLLLLTYFCSNNCCPIEGLSFNPESCPGLSMRGWRFCNSLWFSVQEYLSYERKGSVGL